MRLSSKLRLRRRRGRSECEGSRASEANCVPKLELGNEEVCKPPLLVVSIAAMKLIIALGALTAATLFAQPTPESKTDVSNKALITKATPAVTKSGNDIAALRKLADEFYAWRNENFPVNSSDAGLHTWDNRLTDFSAAKIAERNQHVRKLLDQVRAMPGAKWAKDDRIDWMLFRAQLENFDFGSRVLQSEKTDPQLYVGECTNGIFSLLKKEYDTPRNRALAATERLKQMPAMLAQGERNLQKPVKLFARLAIDSARAIDPLFKDSLMTLARDLPPNERDELVKARDAALAAIHGFADRLEKRLPSMVDFAPMGAANYNYYLKNVLLLPLNDEQVAMLGRAELARYRALESLLPDPSLADPDPSRSKNIPPDQASFLAAYESREQEMISLHEGAQARHDSGLPGPVRDSAIAGRVQADQSRRFHEPARRLRQRSGRLLFHPDLQSAVEELLYSRRD